MYRDRVELYVSRSAMIIQLTGVKHKTNLKTNTVIN